MTELLAFPDAEAVAVAALDAALTVPVSTRVPNPRPAVFVRVARVGGARVNLVTDAPVLVVECWAASSVAAAELARLARAHLFALEGSTTAGAWVRKVLDVAGPQSFPDPVSESPRYQFTAQLHLRGAPL